MLTVLRSWSSLVSRVCSAADISVDKTEAGGWVWIWLMAAHLSLTITANFIILAL